MAACSAMGTTVQPISKDGSRIHPQTFRRLQLVGATLERHGYVERGRRPNLFVRDYGFVRFYADLGGTDEVPVWRDERALFYWFWNPKPGPALELRQRTVLFEWVRLNGVPARLSHALPYDETTTREEALLAEQFDYERRGALFVGTHASWAEARYPWDPYVQDQLDGPIRPPDVDALRTDPAAKLKAPGAERRRRHVAYADPYGHHPARLALVFRSDRADDEILAFYDEVLRTLGWTAVAFHPREQPRRDPADPWAHDSGGREWTRDGWRFRLFLLGGCDRMAYDLGAAPSAFEVWLETPP